MSELEAVTLSNELREAPSCSSLASTFRAASIVTFRTAAIARPGVTASVELKNSIRDASSQSSKNSATACCVCAEPVAMARIAAYAAVLVGRYSARWSACPGPDGEPRFSTACAAICAPSTNTVAPVSECEEMYAAKSERTGVSIDPRMRLLAGRKRSRSCGSKWLGNATTPADDRASWTA